MTGEQGVDAGSGEGPEDGRPDWRHRRQGALTRIGLPVVTTCDERGWPLPWRAQDAVETADGYVVTAPAGVNICDGPAFVTFHEHSETFDGQENIGLAGTATVRHGEVHVRIERALSDFGVARNPLRSAISMIRVGRRLRPRLSAEADRRGVQLPDFADLDFVRVR